MTVKKNTRWIFDLAVLLSLIFISETVAAQKKNILHVHFETARINQSTSDIILRVFYNLEAPKPVTFRGFDCRYAFQNTKIQPVTTFFDGTACQNADDAHGTFVPTDEYRVQVLSGTMLDTANHLLFEVWYSIKGFTDSALIAPILFDVISDQGSAIDTVLIDNSPGRDQVGWYPFALMYADTMKIPPPPPKKRDITFSSDSTDIQSDSIKIVSLNVTSLDSANIKNAIFEFDIDSAAFDSVAVQKGALLSNGVLSLSRDTTHVTAQISKIDTSKPGELLRILLRGKQIQDTICTKIRNPKFTVLNTDNLVASISYKLNGTCVFGKKVDTVFKSVSGSNAVPKFYIAAFPNPASSTINFHVPEGYINKKHLEVFDALGRRVFDSIFDVDLRWEVASASAGIYTATVTHFSALQNRIIAEKTKFLIIH